MSFLGGQSRRPPAPGPRMIFENDRGPAPTTAPAPRVKTCPHCGKDIDEVPAEQANPALIQHYIDTLSDMSLTDWESNFVDSVATQFEARGSLSPKQIATLRRIYEEKS